MSDIIERLQNYIPGEHEEFVPEVNALAIAEIERLRARVTVLEMVIQEELDEFDCSDDANRMIVENIHERGRSVAVGGSRHGD